MKVTHFCIVLSPTDVFVSRMPQVADLMELANSSQKVRRHPIPVKDRSISANWCPSELCVYKDTRQYHTKTSPLSVSDTHIGSPDSHSKPSNLSQSVLASQSSPVTHNSAENHVYFHIIQRQIIKGSINSLIIPDYFI